MRWEDHVVDTQPTEKTKRAIRAGLRRFNEAVKEFGPSDDWDKAVIDTAIAAMVQQGQPFSANSFRELIPNVRNYLISRRLIVAQNQGLIEWKGRMTPSTLESTNAAPIKVYVPVKDDTRPAALPPRPRRKVVLPPAVVDDELALFEMGAS